jgi:renalase
MRSLQSCIIVGAGISGLMTAARLKQYGVEVTIIEKSRSSGGRMAVKELNGAVFDIGAQFMTTRDRRFREQVEEWLEQGHVLPWYTGPLRNMRYVGKEGMNRVPNFLARDYSIHYSQKVSKVDFSGGQWTVTAIPYGTLKTVTYSADWLVLTAPVPQSMKILDDSGIELDYDEEMELRRIKYLKCLAVVAHLDAPAALPNPGAIDLNHEVLRWIADNSVKGITETTGCVTIHSSPRFAETYWDEPEGIRNKAILAAAKPFLKGDVTASAGHRWGLSEPTRVYKEKQPFRKPYFLDEELHLGMAGDGFNGPRIESSAISGRELGEALTMPM